jgi:methionyl-tRNA formyltransferase
MRFAFAGIDFLGDVFQTLIDRGWTPVKLFTRSCDAVYDFNDTVVARARSHKIPIQLSRIRPADVAALGAEGCDAIVVAGYPWLITGWEPHVRYGLNIHPSPLPEGRGPYPLFQAILDRRTEWGISAHVLAPVSKLGAVLARETFPTEPLETHDTLLMKCQMGAKRLATRIAADLPGLWDRAEPQGAGSYWPRITEAQRTLDWSKDVETVLRTVRAFGSIETMARIGDARVFVRRASGWTQAHEHRTGTIVHSHRRNVVVAVRDGFVHFDAWSAVSLEAMRDLGR